MSRHGENIWKRKDGRWEARYVKCHINGRAKYGSVYGKSYAEVKKKRTLTIQQLESHSSNDHVTQILFNDIFEGFLESKSRSIKESTYANYNNLIKWHIQPYWGEQVISSVDSKKIDDYILYLLKTGRVDGQGGLSNKTVKDIIIVLKTILSYSKTFNEIEVSNYSIIMPKVNIATNILPCHDQKKLEEYLISDMNPCNVGIMLSLKLGFRIGEICGLTWKNINLVEKIITIDQTVQRISQKEKFPDSKTKLLIGSPKSISSIRSIPIPSYIAEWLSRLSEGRDENDFFLTGTSLCMEPRNYYRKYRSVLKACNLPEYTFHMLRHTFATTAVQNGFDPKMLAEILGHSGVKVTLERYVHPSVEAKRMQMEKMVSLGS